jgi:hypothetical protein
MYAQVDPLPDVIPDDYYTYALPTAHEQEALKDLLRPATPSKSGNVASLGLRSTSATNAGYDTDSTSGTYLPTPSCLHVDMLRNFHGRKDETGTLLR